MDKDIADKLVYNLLVELKKKNIDKEEMRILLDDYIKRNGVSLRELAKQIGISHTTLYYWKEPDKKKQISEFQSMKQTKLKITDELVMIKNKLLDYQHKINANKLSLTNNDRKLISEIKELILWIYMNTLVLKV